MAGRLYAIGARLRRDAARGEGARLQRPVVSVGNLAMGGTGKTPLVAYVARLLQDAGQRPSILSRGYARTRPDDGVTVVSDGVRLRADIERAGDEPLMLARRLPRVPVLVSPNRYLAGLLAERHLGVTVHILDDGFQHLGLARDVDLLIVDPADLQRPRVLPAGRLRESADAARHAHALLITGSDDDPQAVADRYGVGRGFSLIREVGPALEDRPDGMEVVPRGTRVLIVSGIAHPARFEQEAREAGFDVAGTQAFRDHHPFSPADVADIARRAAGARADLVLTTEKDLMRLLPLRPWPFRVAVRPLSVRVEPSSFGEWLLGQLPRGSQTAGVPA